MNIRNQIVSALLCIYPAAWRKEYGAELAHMLRSRSLCACDVCDVAWNGLRERFRGAEANAALALIMLITISWGLASKQILLEDSAITLPRVFVGALRSVLYDALMVLCGCWTYLANGLDVTKSGKSAMAITLVAGIPIMLLGALALAGILDVAPFYAGHRPPDALMVFLAPLFALPQAWLYGRAGGELGKRISRV